MQVLCYSRQCVLFVNFGLGMILLKISTTEKISYSHLFRSKHSSNVVSHAVTAACAQYCGAFALSHLVSACNAHTSGDDAVGLQDENHLGIFL